MSEQVGLRGLLANLREETPYWVSMLPQLPRLFHSYLARNDVDTMRQEIRAQSAKIKSISRLLLGTATLLTAAVAVLAVLLLR